MGVELLARDMFRAGQATEVIAVQLPKPQAFMHLDTLLTMIVVANFIRYPDVNPTSPSLWSITPTDPMDTVEHDFVRLHIEKGEDLFATIADPLGLNKVRVRCADEDVRAAQRDQ